MAKADYRVWSGEELSLLLRAWVQESARAPKSTQSAVSQRFQTLCRDAGFAHSRADPSVVFKLNSMRNMHVVISVFLASPLAATAHSDNANTLRQESGGNGSGDGPLRAWFAMPKPERRRFFAAINRKSYLYTEITLEQFELIHSVVTKDGKQAFVLPEAYQDSSYDLHTGEQAGAAVGGSLKVKREAKLALEPTISISEAIAVIQDASEHFKIVMKRFTKSKPFDSHQTTNNSTSAAGTAAGLSAPPSSPLRSESNRFVAHESGSCTAQTEEAPTQPGSSELPAHDDGSSTESEDEWDEIVPRSPAREEEGIAPTSTKEESKTFEYDYCDGAVADPGNETLKRSLSPAEPVYPEKRSRGVQPEVSLLMDALKQQTFALKDMLRKAKGGLKRDQLERKQILTHLRQEHDTRYEVVKRLQREEDETRRQRAEWRRERDELVREWAKVGSGNK